MRQINYKRLALCPLLLVVLSTLVFFAALFVYDPVSIFHKPWGRPFTVHGNQRIQNLALIREFEFDSVIIGNSYTENTSAAEAGEMLGGKFFNFSMSGSSLAESSIVLDYILRQKPIKTVFAVFSDGIGRGGHGGYPFETWAFLYDSDPLNDIALYMNEHFLACLGKWSYEKSCVGGEVDFDKPWAWENDPDHASRFGGLDNWILYHENVQLADFLHTDLPRAAATLPKEQKEISADKLQDIRDYLNEFLIEQAKKYPQTRFVYFLTPVSRLFLAVRYHTNSYSFYEAFVRVAVDMTRDVPNVEIYAFGDQDFTGDIALYKDITHYSPGINSWILRAVKEGKGLLRPENVEAYLKRTRDSVRAYDLEAINHYVQERLPGDKASVNGD